MMRTLSKAHFALLAGLLTVAGGAPGCQIFKKKNTSSVKSTPASTRLSKVPWSYASSARVSTKISDTNTLVIPIHVNDVSIAKNTGKLNVSLSSDDSNFFFSNPEKHSVKIKIVKNGATFIDSVSIKNGYYHISS
jgi:hypothetical protein